MAEFADEFLGEGGEGEGGEGEGGEGEDDWRWRLGPTGSIGSIASVDEDESTPEEPTKYFTQFQNQVVEWKVPKESLTSLFSGSIPDFSYWMNFTDWDGKGKSSYWKFYFKRTETDNGRYVGIFVQLDDNDDKSESLSLSPCSICGELGITVIHPNHQNNIIKNWKSEPINFPTNACGVTEVIQEAQLNEFIHDDNQLHVILDFTLVRQENQERALAEIKSGNRYGIDLATLDPHIKDLLIKTSDNKTLAVNQSIISAKSEYFREALVRLKSTPLAQGSQQNNQLELEVDKPENIMQLVLWHICSGDWIERYLATPEVKEIAGELATAADDFKLPILKKFLGMVYFKQRN